jgi:predicted AAA+ superfamily ATPase
MQAYFTFGRLNVKCIYMIGRPYWTKRVDASWAKAPVVWLTGVRRVGKTTLARGNQDALYLNCDLPSTALQLDDPERFYKSISTDKIIFDEVHQLSNPSQLLKIGADTFSQLKILATGSSTLAATKKFRDSLTGRKRTVHLLPVLIEELDAFGITDLKQRLIHGGLPEALLSREIDPDFYGEWIDSFYSRDVQELFHVEKRSGFLKLLEILLRNSGSLIEITNLSKYTGLTRPTVMNYLQVLQITHAIYLLRPYSAGGRREIIAQQKVYGFDTGFVAHSRGWNDLRNEDCGALWEHVVLETLLSIFGDTGVYFWRDKQQREIDFVIPRGRSACDIIECKWSSDKFDTRGLKAFRANYPEGKNLFCSPQIGKKYSRKLDGHTITFVNASDLRSIFSNELS